MHPYGIGKGPDPTRDYKSAHYVDNWFRNRKRQLERRIEKGELPMMETLEAYDCVEYAKKFKAKQLAMCRAVTGKGDACSRRAFGGGCYCRIHAKMDPLLCEPAPPPPPQEGHEAIRFAVRSFMRDLDEILAPLSVN
jgi:hypothetical protein